MKWWDKLSFRSRPISIAAAATVPPPPVRIENKTAFMMCIHNIRKTPTRRLSHLCCACARRESRLSSRVRVVCVCCVVGTCSTLMRRYTPHTCQYVGQLFAKWLIDCVRVRCVLVCANAKHRHRHVYDGVCFSARHFCCALEPGDISGRKMRGGCHDTHTHTHI